MHVTNGIPLVCPLLTGWHYKFLPTTEGVATIQSSLGITVDDVTATFDTMDFDRAARNKKAEKAAAAARKQAEEDAALFARAEEAKDAEHMQAGEKVTLSSDLTTVQVVSKWDGGVDLDAGIMLYNEDKSEWAHCDFGTKNVASGTVTMDGDAQGGSGQQEILTVNLQQLPATVTCVICAVCIYDSGSTFADASNVAIQINDTTGGKSAMLVRLLVFLTKVNGSCSSMLSDPSPACLECLHPAYVRSVWYPTARFSWKCSLLSPFLPPFDGVGNTNRRKRRPMPCKG
jgi:stress response protein SCP2